MPKFVVLYFLDNQCFQNYEYGRVEYPELYNTRNICSNAAPKLSLQMQCQSYRRKRTIKVFVGNAVTKLSLQMQRQSCRCKCTAKVIAGNAVPKLSLQMQRQLQSCRCKCSAKVVAPTGPYAGFFCQGGKRAEGPYIFKYEATFILPYIFKVK